MLLQNVYVLALNTAFFGTSESRGTRMMIKVPTEATATTPVPTFLWVRWKMMQQRIATAQIAVIPNKPIPTPCTRNVMT